MKKLDILEKALDKAMKKNYKSPFDFIYEKGKLIEGKNYYAIIFDKDFCKAIWSEEKKFFAFSNSHPHLGDNVSLWEWHLKQMVVCDNPISYLYENLELDNWEKVENKN